MQRKYTPQLIIRAQRIFERKSGRAVSEEETEICLDRLATFGELTMRVMELEREKENSRQGRNINRNQT